MGPTQLDTLTGQQVQSQSDNAQGQWNYSNTTGGWQVSADMATGPAFNDASEIAATAEANTAAPASGSAGYAAYESAATTTTYPGSAQPLPSAGYNAAPTSLPLGYNAEAAAASEWTSANPSVPQMVNPYESSELAALFGGSTSSGNTATPAATGSQITINITGMTTQNAQSVAQQMVTALKNAGIGKLT